MAYQKYDVALYKVLAYAYECMQRNVNPDINKARELSGVNETFFRSIIQDALKDGLIDGVHFIDYIALAEPFMEADQFRITRTGVNFLCDNDKMQQVIAAIRTTFQAILVAAVEATIKATMGV